MNWNLFHEQVFTLRVLRQLMRKTVFLPTIFRKHPKRMFDIKHHDELHSEQVVNLCTKLCLHVFNSVRRTLLLACTRKRITKIKLTEKPRQIKYFFNVFDVHSLLMLNILIKIDIFLCTSCAVILILDIGSVYFYLLVHHRIENI